MLVVGTSAVVAPASELPVLALRFGAKLLVMDPDPPLLADAADVVLPGRSEALLPELVERAFAHPS
jgi:NAD-dependent deacetylase